jgi:hypothetical protein
MHNYVHDNNNPNVPSVGIASNAPTGTGLFLYGGRNDTIMDNTFTNNGAWGAIVFTYPATDTPPPNAVAAGDDCKGGVGSGQSGNGACVFDDWGNAIVNNKFHNNGFFKSSAGPGGNLSNADFGEITSTANSTNCFHGNVELGGGSASSSPPGLETLKPVCDQHTVPPDPNHAMTNDLACDSEALGTPCTPGSYYPQPQGVPPMPALPSNLSSMPDPCTYVPRNPWCPNNSVNPPGYPVPGAICAGRSALVVHLRRRISPRLRHVSVTVNGHSVHVSRNLTVRVDLRNLSQSTVLVRVRGRLRDGRRINRTLRYHPCASRSARRTRRTRHR